MFCFEENFISEKKDSKLSLENYLFIRKISEEEVKKGRITQEKVDVAISDLNNLFPEYERYYKNNKLKREIIIIPATNQAVTLEKPKRLEHINIFTKINHRLEKSYYISPTDIARNHNTKNPSYAVQSWLRDYSTLEFLRLWEQQVNDEFNNKACDEIIYLMKKTTFTLTPKQWISKTSAKGIESRQGKGGGTLAHPDIAMEFRMWLDPKFRMDVIKKYREVDE